MIITSYFLLYFAFTAGVLFTLQNVNHFDFADNDSSENDAGSVDMAMRGTSLFLFVAFF